MYHYAMFDNDMTRSFSFNFHIYTEPCIPVKTTLGTDNEQNISIIRLVLKKQYFYCDFESYGVYSTLDGNLFFIFITPEYILRKDFFALY
jgi:hypothetical protein